MARTPQMLTVIAPGIDAVTPALYLSPVLFHQAGLSASSKENLVGLAQVSPKAATVRHFPRG